MTIYQCLHNLYPLIPMKLYAKPKPWSLNINSEQIIAKSTKTTPVVRSIFYCLVFDLSFFIVPIISTKMSELELFLKSQKPNKELHCHFDSWVGFIPIDNICIPDRQTDRYFIDRKKVNPDLFVIEIREICTSIYNIVNLWGSYDNIHSMTYTTAANRLCQLNRRSPKRR